MAKTHSKTIARRKRVQRIRKKVVGTSQRPRLRVYKSNKHIYAQIIDDTKGHTLAASSTKTCDCAGAEGKVSQAERVGQDIAAKAKAKGIESVVFDRGGYIYHGRVKALSEGARQGGLLF